MGKKRWHCVCGAMCSGICGILPCKYGNRRLAGLAESDSVAAYLADVAEKRMKVGKKELWQLLKFWLCTQIAVVADAGSFAIMYALAPAYYMLCKALSYCIGAVVSYFTNRRFTFQTTQSQRGIIWKFTVVNLVSMGVSLGAMGIMSSNFGIPVWLSYILSGFFSFITNFLGNRLWVFHE